MGQYTDSQNFYKPDSDELVDVESQIEYNWRRADSRVKSLVEWQWTDESSITNGIENRERGMKYYKSYSNSFWVIRDTENPTVYQHSSNGDVDPWVTDGISFVSDYTYENADERVAYRKDPTSGMVSWRGSVIRTSYGILPRNTNTDFMDIPAEAAPVRAKYFIVHLGIVSGGYWVARILFPTSGPVEFNLMGSSSAGDADQRTISLNDIHYPTDDV